VQAEKKIRRLSRWISSRHSSVIEGRPPGGFAAEFGWTFGTSPLLGQLTLRQPRLRDLGPEAFEASRGPAIDALVYRLHPV
jgi:hypothetical protein